MPKTVDNSVLDAALNEIIDNADEVVICEGQPLVFANANTVKGSGGNQLGAASITGTDFTGPADGDVSGRKLTFGGKTGVSITDSGDWNYLALIDTVGSRLLLVTSAIGTKAVVASTTEDAPSFDYELRDPT